MEIIRKSTIELPTLFLLTFFKGGHYVLAIFTNALVSVFGCRPVAFTGGLAAMGAFLVSAYSTTITMFLVSYGLIGGVSLGLIYLPSTLTLNLCFNNNRALACSITKFGGRAGH